MDGSKGSPAGEGVLQNFFNSLLNRKSGAGLASPGGGSPRNPNEKSRVEVAAELDRLVQGSPTTPTHTPLKKPMDLATTPQQSLSEQSTE